MPGKGWDEAFCPGLSACSAAVPLRTSRPLGEGALLTASCAAAVPTCPWEPAETCRLPQVYGFSCGRLQYTPLRFMRAPVCSRCYHDRSLLLSAGHGSAFRDLVGNFCAPDRPTWLPVSWIFFFCPLLGDLFEGENIVFCVLVVHQQQSVA